MIDYKNLQTKIISDYLKENQKNWLYCEFDERNIAFIDPKGTMVLIIPTFQTIIDLNKLDRFEALKKIINDTNYDESQRIVEICQKRHSEGTVCQLANDSLELYVDAKKLAMFGKNVFYTGTQKIKPVYVYDDLKNFIGMILPIKVK